MKFCITFAKSQQKLFEHTRKRNFFQFPFFAAGLVCFGLVFVVEQLGGVFSIGIALSGITSGTLLGLFTIGMVRGRPYFPRKTLTRNIFPQISRKFNTKGALWGSIVSIVVVSFIAVGAQINIYKGNLLYETLPLSIESCDAPTRIDTMT